MRIQYANKLFQKLGMGDPKKCVYQLIYDKNDSDDTNITQYFIMDGLGICIKVDSFVSHMFHAWSLSNNTAVPIAIKKNPYFIPLNTNNIVFDWRDGNSNKNRTQQLDSII